MTVIKKTIGRLPVLIGEYDSTRSYGKKNRVTLFGSEFESKHDNNITSPATWDGSETVTFNEVDWQVISNGTSAWIAGNDKPAASEDFPYNGMGRIILKKNMVNIAEEGEEPNIVNLLTQSAFEDSDENPLTNTIFVIKYDFTLGEDITVPANCVLEFDGGSLSNASENTYKIYGNKASFSNATYNIFNNVDFVDFTIPYIDLRWVGGVPDYDRQQNTGTDNAPYFERAINLIGKYYSGLHIAIIGSYYISTGISTYYDLNICGYHNNCRDLSTQGYGEDNIIESSVVVAPNVTAFTMNPRLDGESEPYTFGYSYFSIKNVLLKGTGEDGIGRTKVRTSNFIEYKAGGAPSRVCVIEECEIRNFNKFLYVNNVDTGDTSIGDLTISKCNAYFNNKFVCTNSAAGQTRRTFANLLIKDSNIEHNGEKCIELYMTFGYIGIINNILEGQILPIYIVSAKTGSCIEILNNYFENGLDYSEEIIHIQSDEIRDINRNYLKIHNHFENGRRYAHTLISQHILEADFDHFSDNSVVENSIVDCDTRCFNINWISTSSYFTKYRNGIVTKGFGLSDVKNGFVGKQIGKTSYTRSDQGYTFSEREQTTKFVAFWINHNAKLAAGFAINDSIPGPVTVSSWLLKDCLVIGRVTFTPISGNYGFWIKDVSGNDIDNSYCYIGSFQILEDTEVSPENICVSTVNDRAIQHHANVTFNKPEGYELYDLGLKKNIIWDGTQWVDATGTPV